MKKGASDVTAIMTLLGDGGSSLSRAVLFSAPKSPAALISISSLFLFSGLHLLKPA